MTGRALLLLAGGALSCAGAGRGPVFATSERFPETPREPPSFAAERAVVADEGRAEPPLPEPSSLRRVEIPLDAEAAHELVGRFFMAVLLESTRDLFPLFSAQAIVISEGSRLSAQSVWRSRFAQLDYTSLSGRLVAAPQSLRTYTFESAARAKRDGVPPPASATEVVVVARPAGVWASKTRLFGEALAFRLRPKTTERGAQVGFEIAEIVEDFRLP